MPKEPTHDELFEEMIPWRNHTPEMFAARFGRTLGCFSYRGDELENPALNQWVAQFSKIFSDTKQMAKLRKQLLPPEEYQQIEELWQRNDLL